MNVKIYMQKPTTTLAILAIRMVKVSMNKKKNDMSKNKNVSKTQGWFKIIKAIIIVIVIFSPIIYSFGFAMGEENKCRNYCCTMFIKAIGVIIKHEGEEDEKILHSGPVSY